jgi:hypothetical protein
MTPLGKPLVGALPVEVGDVRPQGTAEVGLAQDEQVVEALAADTPQDPLTDRVP